MSKEDESRFTITLSKAHRAKLAAKAKQFHISQGEVIEVMLDADDGVALDDLFRAKRIEKVNGRTSIRSVIERERMKRKSQEGEQH